MRAAGGSRVRFVFASLAVHAAAWAMVGRERVGARVVVATERAREVEVDVRRVPVRESVRVRESAGESVHEHEHEHEHEYEHADAPHVDAEDADERRSANARGVELFPEATLRASVGAAKPEWGGRTRRPGDADDREEEAHVVAKRVGGFLADAMGEERARANVPPEWRDVERQIDAGFHPSASAVTDESPVKTLVRQLFTNAPTGGAMPRAIDPSVEADPKISRALQIAACQRATEDAAKWLRTEVVVEVGADGRLRSARVASPSGRARLDAAALDAVRRAVALRPIRDPCRGRAPDCAITTRWAVDAAKTVRPPVVTPLVDPITSRIEGATVSLFSLSFDETGGKPKLTLPFQSEVRTRVSLLGIQ